MTALKRALFTPVAEQYEAFAAANGDDRSVDALYDLADTFDDALARAVPNTRPLGPLVAARAALLRLRRLSALSTDRLTVAAQSRAATCRAIAVGDAAEAGRLNHERVQASLAHSPSIVLAGKTAPLVPPALDLDTDR